MRVYIGELVIESFQEFKDFVLIMKFTKIDNRSTGTRNGAHAIFVRKISIYLLPNRCELSKVVRDIERTLLKTNNVILKVENMENVALREKISKIFLNL